MDEPMDFYEQFVLDERMTPLGSPREDSRSLIRYPELCHEQRYKHPEHLMFGSSEINLVHSQAQADQPRVESAETVGHNPNSGVDPKTLCMKLGGVYSSKEPRFYFSEYERKLVPVWIASNILVDWCRCDVKGLLEFTQYLHRTLERANVWSGYQSETLKEMDGIVISTTGPLGPEVVYSKVPNKEPVAQEVDDMLFRVPINEEALSDMVATGPQTPTVLTGPPTSDDAYSTDSEGETSGEIPYLESHQSGVNQSARPALSDDVTITQDIPGNKNLGRLVGESEERDPNPPVLSGHDPQTVAGVSMVAGISVEVPNLTPEEVSHALEYGSWMDALMRFPKAQRPLTIVGQGAVKKYLDANVSIRLKPGKIDQDLKRIEKEANEAAKGTITTTTKKPHTIVTNTIMPLTSTKDPDPPHREKRKRNRNLPPPDLMLRTAKGVVVPETITVCRAQVNMVGGKWLVSRDKSCSMAIRASQEYRRHFVERHLGGQRPMKYESREATPDPSPKKDGTLSQGDLFQSVAENDVAGSVPQKSKPTTQPAEGLVGIANDRIGRKGKGKRQRDDSNADYEATKRVRKAHKRPVQKDASSSEAIVSLQDPRT